MFEQKGRVLIIGAQLTLEMTLHICLDKRAEKEVVKDSDSDFAEPKYFPSIRKINVPKLEFTIFLPHMLEIHLDRHVKDCAIDFRCPLDGSFEPMFNKTKFSVIMKVKGDCFDNHTITSYDLFEVPLEDARIAVTELIKSAEAVITGEDIKNLDISLNTSNMQTSYYVDASEGTTPCRGMHVSISDIAIKETVYHY